MERSTWSSPNLAVRRTKEERSSSDIEPSGSGSIYNVFENTLTTNCKRCGKDLLSRDKLFKHPKDCEARHPQIARLRQLHHG